MKKYLLFLSSLAIGMLVVTWSASAMASELLLASGLPSKNITGVCKDNRGLMWIGTSAGLYTYDGYDFAPLQGNTEFQGFPINSIAYDQRKDLLWVACAKGLFSIRCATLKIYEHTLGTSWHSRAVTSMELDNEGHVYACIQTGVLIEAWENHPAKYLASIPTVASSDYPSWIEKKQDRLVVGLLKHTDFFEFLLKERCLKTISARDFKMPHKIERLHRRLTFHLREDNRQWSFSLQGKAEEKFADQLLQLYDIKAIHFLSDSIAYIICNPCHIYKVSFRERKCEQVNAQMFVGFIANSTYLDAHRILWIGTNKGLVKITSEDHFFSAELVQVPPASVRSCIEDSSGNLYCGTYKGLFRKPSASAIWTKISGATPMAMLNVPGPYVYFIKEQQPQLKLLNRIDKRNGRVESGFYHSSGQETTKTRSGYALTAAPSGILWIGMNSGLAKYNPLTQELSLISEKPWSDDSPEIRYILPKPDHKVWVGTTNGLYLVDSTGKVIRRWHVDSKPALTSNTINHIVTDTAGRLWLCTGGGGINILSKNGQKMTFLDTRNGLSDNTTYNLMLQENNVWISTYMGISCYNQSRKRFYNFYTDDGLNDNECNRNAYLKDRSGKMYFGTVNGLNSFYPNEMMFSSRQVKLLISTITKWDNVARTYVNLPVPDANQTILLKPRDNSLILNLALNDYTHLERAIYSYRIRNLSKDWITMRNQHSIQLNGLRPGAYIVEIAATDSRGLAAANNLICHIEVLTPFTRSWWFYSLLFLIACLLICGLIWLRVNRIRQLLNLRQMIAADLHDELGSLLTRITMASDNLLLTNSSLTLKKEKLRKISFLSRRASSSMRDVLWTIDTRNDFSGDLSDRMQEHATEMLKPLNSNIVFNIGINEKTYIEPKIRQQLYLIFKELINNIIKHSEAKNVVIAFYNDKKNLLLKVANDGIKHGNKPDGRSSGIKNIKMRAEKIRATVTITQENNLFEIVINRKY